MSKASPTRKMILIGYHFRGVSILLQLCSRLSTKFGLSKSNQTLFCLRDFTFVMATNAKRENLEDLEDLENSELEAMRVKIRKLEATVKANAEELLMLKNDHVDHEGQENDVVDFLSRFINNHGFKRIADNLLSFLDCKSFNQCRLVCGSWKNYIDNEWSMLQLQIFHLKRFEHNYHNSDETYFPLLVEDWLNFGPLFKVMEKTTNKSELRIFIKMCQELVSKYCNRKLEMLPLEYMIDHHRHEELKLLLHCPLQKIPENEWREYKGFACFTRVFKYACQFGCEICVKLLLDRSEEKEIDLNLVKKWTRIHRGFWNETKEYQFEHCVFAAFYNHTNFRKKVLDLLIRSAEEKGIDIHTTKSYYGETLREAIINSLDRRIMDCNDIEDYTEETFKIMKIDPSVDLEFESESGSETN